MNIQNISFPWSDKNYSGSRVASNGSNLPGSSKFFCIMGYVSSDDKTVNFLPDGRYNYHVQGRNLFTGKNMTDEEKWMAITSEYAGKVITYKDFAQMLMDMCASGLMTINEAGMIGAHVSSVMDGRKEEYHQLGIYDFIDPLYSFISVNFAELLADLSSDERTYVCDEAHDPRPYLREFYTKMISLLSGCAISNCSA